MFAPAFSSTDLRPPLELELVELEELDVDPDEAPEDDSSPEEPDEVLPRWPDAPLDAPASSSAPVVVVVSAPQAATTRARPAAATAPNMNSKRMRRGLAQRRESASAISRFS